MFAAIFNRNASALFASEIALEFAVDLFVVAIDFDLDLIDVVGLLDFGMFGFVLLELPLPLPQLVLALYDPVLPATLVRIVVKYNKMDLLS